MNVLNNNGTRSRFRSVRLGLQDTPIEM